LAVSQRGDIVINRADGQRFCIGNLYRQEGLTPMLDAKTATMPRDSATTRCRPSL
jgi:hypothetical protein